MRVVAGLIQFAKHVTCTAHTDRDRGDVELTRAQARAACNELARQGLEGKVTSVGAGHAKPRESNDTPKGRVANRRIRITFRF